MATAQHEVESEVIELGIRAYTPYRKLDVKAIIVSGGTKYFRPENLKWKASARTIHASTSIKSIGIISEIRPGALNEDANGRYFHAM